MSLLKTLEIISQIPGVSGREDAVRAAITAELDGICEYQIDPLGNVIAFKKGKQRAQNKILLSAHMDEVGFIVTYIEESGLLRFAPVGGIDTRVVLGKPVEVGEKRVWGLIGTKPIHLTEEKDSEKALKFEQMQIDIGAKDRAEAEQYVRPGDRAVFASGFSYLGENMIMGRAFDDRAGCALLLDLARSDLEYDCWFSFTVQEESGCTGAITAGYTVAPAIAVAVETTTASDIAGVSPDKTVCALGRGGVLSFMDKGTVYDYDLYAAARDMAAEKGIPCQPKQGVFGGNESRSLQVARGGAHTLAVSLPCRYLHTAQNVLSIDDIRTTRILLEAIIEMAAVL